MNRATAFLLLLFAAIAALPATLRANEDSEMPAWMTAPYATMEGTTETLATAYPGKTVVVVNVASRCGYTRQYADLQKLQQQYADRGLVVVAFPSNDYGGQEPGTDAEILEFCESRFSVTFPVKSKMPTRGDGKSPLYAALTGPDSPKPGEVKWNFEKFVIAPDGRIVARLGSATEPTSAEMVKAVEEAVGG
ncbi:MAG: glutathione peroxidase [Candidatus Sumerlaeia bacterium]|nr:glutathione peroxidase [Candidatus Sumerlaeia bacterium]